MDHCSSCHGPLGSSSGIRGRHHTERTQPLPMAVLANLIQLELTRWLSSNRVGVNMPGTLS